MSDSYVEAAHRACAAWEVDAHAISEVARAENVVFRVDLADGERRVLRIHRPGYTTHRQLESEVRWVLALSGAGLPVPQPIERPGGGYYATVAVDGVDHAVGMISWVRGAPIREQGGPVTPHFRSIGVVAGEIRRHSGTWAIPSGFERRRWDAETLMGASPAWGRFWDAATLEPADRRLFEAVRIDLFDELRALSTGPDRFGLIHADLHLGNVMVDGTDATVIDFDDSGFGWYAHELGVTLQTVVDEPDYDEARALLLEGYRSVVELSLEEEATIDMFVLVRRLMLVGWLDARSNLDQFEWRFQGLVEGARSASERWLTARR